MGRNPPPQSPHPPQSDAAERLLVAVESIAHNLEGLRRDLAVIHKRGGAPSITRDQFFAQQLTGVADLARDLARDLLAPYLRRR